MDEMAPDVIEGLVILTSVLVGTACYRAWTAQTAHLKLSLFQPYRGDPWPIGVQEDDDFRFNWTPSGATPATEVAAETFAGVNDHEPAGVTQLILLEEVPRGQIVIERVDTITVRRGGR
jgi:hypothetical protein